MSKKSSLNKLWVEKYRPTSISEVIFQNDAHSNFFKGVVKSQELPNLLLSGVQGTGKTTISLALMNDLGVHPADVLLVKCSDVGMNNTRDVVSRFAETMPIGNFKVVRMEEADYLHHTEQAILRHIIEDNSANCRFILTCNYANKLRPSIKSRLQEFEFKAPDQELIFEKMIDMLDQETVKIETEESINILGKIVSATYPDIRKTIQVLQQSCQTINDEVQLVWTAADTTGSDYKFKLLDLLEKNDFSAARKLVCENIQREEYDDLYQWMYQNIGKIPKFAEISKQEQAIVIIADYLFKHASVSHPDINLAAMFITLGQL